MSATWSAFVNAVSSCCDAMPAGDFGGRLETAVVCAALAAAQASGRSAGDLLAGIAGGLEVGVRLERGLGDRHAGRGWDIAGTAGHVAAAVAAARASRLPPSGVLAALGVGATEAAGLRAALGTPVAALHVAKAAMDGVAAACLARAGLDGPREPIEGRRGLLALAAEGGNPPVITDGLGETWQFAGADGPVLSRDVVGHPGSGAPSDGSAEVAGEESARELAESGLLADGDGLEGLLLWCDDQARNQC